MNSLKIIGKKIERIDGKDKVTGRLKFMGDMQMENMAFAALVHPPIAHANIRSIDTSEAESFPGVVRVVTAKDIPGINLHGLLRKDQPVLCDEKVRYLGDSVAVVVAESKQAASEAAKLVKVDYQPLPIYLTPKESLAEGALPIHVDCPDNVLARPSHKKGNVEEAFEKSHLIVENVYTTPYQEHAYLECESGIARPLPEGGVEIFIGCQNGMRVQRDLSSVLGLPLEKIRVHSHPLGGGFGGKEDLLLQGLLCVCAMVVDRPVFLELSREDSFLISTKRVPFEIHMKTGVDRDGKIIAHQAYVLGQAGAYDSYSSAVQAFAMENVCSIYDIPNIDVRGEMVLTNNALSGSFRGFGNNQSTFAMESQIDIIAHQLKLDPLDIRKKNSAREGEAYVYGQTMSKDQFSIRTLERAESSELWKFREKWKSESPKPWIRRGVGIATGQHGNGIGSVIPVDASRARLRLCDDGRLLLVFGHDDMGQGTITTLSMIAAEYMQMPVDNVDVINGDSFLTPDSGPSTASRTTFITGNAIRLAARKLKLAIAYELGISIEDLVFDFENKQINGYTYGQIAAMLPEKSREHEGVAIFKTPPEKLSFGLHYMTTQVTQISAVEVNTLTGQTRVIENIIVPAAGRVINKLGYDGQCEGGAVQGQGYALNENFRTNKDGAPITKNFQTYLLPTMADTPKITILPIEDEIEDGPFGARGVAEPATILGAASIANAIFDAVGIRMCDVPFDQERILLALDENKRASKR